MKFIDDKSKNINWWTRNYFYLGTALFIAVCILIHAFYGSFTPDVVGDSQVTWGGFNLINIIQGCFCNIFHFNWMHVLLNMLCFAGCGLYIERKTGTIKFILLTIVTIILDAAFCAGAGLSLGWIGASGIQYAMYGYIIIDYIFSFIRKKQNKTNIILGGTILALIYLSMCFDGGVSTFSFAWYPYDLLNNLGHVSGFVVGILICLIIQVSKLFVKEDNVREVLSVKLKKIYKIVYISSLCVVFSLMSLCVICCPIANSRKEINVNITCNYEEYNANIKLETGAYFYDLYSEKWANNVVDLENKDRYVCLLSWGEEKITSGFSFKSTEEFVPLAVPVNYNFNFDILKAYRVSNFSSDYRIRKIVGYNTTNDGNSGLRGLTYTSYNQINEGADYKFMVELYFHPNLNDFKVYNNGIEIELEDDGFYYIRNVSEDINITYSFDS